MIFPTYWYATYIGSNKRFNKNPYVFSPVHNETVEEIMESILKLPYSIYIEKDRNTDIDVLLKALSEDAPGIAISLTTSSCYACDLPRIMTNTLNNRFRLSGDKNLNITTCLQEAVANAIFHGNLEVVGNINEKEIEYLLSIKGMRRISIKAWDKSNHLQISVNDEGKGFSLTGIDLNDNSTNARGLAFINSLSDKIWLGEDKRTLYMTFNY